MVLDQFEVEAPSASTSLTDLSPFTVYECVISARTGAGEGSASEPQTVRTNEAGERIIAHLAYALAPILTHHNAVLFDPHYHSPL